jgi:sugar phosphate isomerase/epimerase
MKLAVSNIAWAPSDAPRAYRMLSEHGVCGLEVAPGVLFPACPDPISPSERDLSTALEAVSRAGLTLVSMQAVLYGVAGAELFGPPAARAAFSRGIARATELAGRLGIPNIVIGAPRQRIVPKHMTSDEAADIAASTFSALGDVAASNSVTLALEANPAVYGTNFLVDTQEVHDFVRRLCHRAVRINLDTGAAFHSCQANYLTTNAKELSALTSHVHLSEPYLSPSLADVERVASITQSLADAGYIGWFSIEMQRSKDGSLASLGHTLSKLVQIRSTAKSSEVTREPEA